MPKIDTLQVSLRGENEVEITRNFPGPRNLLFDCHTKPDLVRRWLFGFDGWKLAVCDIDLRGSGRYRYEWQEIATGNSMGMGGSFREVVPNELLVTTELFDEDWTGGETIVTTRFLGDGNTSRIEMVILYSSAAAREAALKTGMTDGMEFSYQRLDGLLAGTP